MRRGASVLFEVGAGGRLGRTVDLCIAGLIVSNVAALMLETVGWIEATYGGYFLAFEFVSITVFTVEYAGRLWTSTELERYDHWLFGRLRYALTPYMIVDLMAILPFYVMVTLVGGGVDLRFLRGLRLFRFVRLLKLTRHSESVQMLVRAGRLKRDELAITSFAVVILLVTASSLMYFAERGAQPEEFSSIPASLWWGVVTLTTVGYGDVHPVTPVGKAIGMAVAVMGIGVVALPASILASGFVQIAREDVQTCPHCGREFTVEESESDGEV